MDTFSYKRSYAFLTVTIFLAGAFIYMIQTYKWMYTVNNNKQVHSDGDFEVDSQMEYYDGWNIIYDEVKVRSEVERIHGDNYKVKEGDKCVHTVPDCIIVGVAKCGTRELTDFMSIHPNIVSKRNPYMIRSKRFTNLSGHNKIRMKMPCKYADQISVLKADSFLTKDTMPGDIFRLNPNMKIIAIVREPVSRIISHLSFNTKKGATKGKDKPRTKNITLWLNHIVDNLGFQEDGLVRLSKYDVGLQNYLNTFKRENILVIESSEFKTDPTNVLKIIENFLGIRSFISNEYFAFNPLKNFYCIRKTKTVSKTMVCYESNRGRKQSIEIGQQKMEELHNFFKPHNENLYRLIGKRYDW